MHFVILFFICFFQRNILSWKRKGMKSHFSLSTTTNECNVVVVCAFCMFLLSEKHVEYGKDLNFFFSFHCCYYKLFTPSHNWWWWRYRHLIRPVMYVFFSFFHEKHIHLKNPCKLYTVTTGKSKVNETTFLIRNNNDSICVFLYTYT